jgi:serine/threonine protein kinase
LAKKEATLLNKLNHPNVVKAKHIIKLKDKYYTGMEFLAG